MIRRFSTSRVATFRRFPSELRLTSTRHLKAPDGANFFSGGLFLLRGNKSFYDVRNSCGNVLINRRSILCQNFYGIDDSTKRRDSLEINRRRVARLYYQFQRNRGGSVKDGKTRARVAILLSRRSFLDHGRGKMADSGDAGEI